MVDGSARGDREYYRTSRQEAVTRFDGGGDVARDSPARLVLSVCASKCC